MPTDKNRPASLVATQQSVFVLPTVVAVVIIAYWVWRDGFSWGDLLGGLLIWVGTCATLALLRWYSRR